MARREKISKNGILHRIIRILLIVVLGLLIIYGLFYSINKKKNVEFSPPNCEEKVWCLDYNTIAIRENNCVVKTIDCSDSERCLNGKCVLKI